MGAEGGLLVIPGIAFVYTIKKIKIMTQRRPIISARRTDNLEALLQKLWTLQPLYKDKHAFTIAAGVAALIREIERSGTAHQSPLVTTVEKVEATVKKEMTDSEKNEAADSHSEPAKPELSTNVEWD